MNRRHKSIAVIAALVLSLTACAERNLSNTDRPGGTASGASTDAPDGTEADPSASGVSTDPQTGQRYIEELVQETIALFSEPEMSEYEKAKAAFDYMIENITLLDPVGLDLWQIRGDVGDPPSYVENRSLSVLLFQLGKCEDYAAAYTLLLRGMGIEAVYVPGLTYSTQGELVDHAWTIAKIDGVWYHLDSQLEQNISRHGSIRYKYFMRGDATMRESHRWGQNLIDSGLLTAEQNEEIAQFYIPPACPENYPTPERRACTLADSPDVDAIQAAIDAEFAQYEETHGPLDPQESNIVPPVFALEGYGPQD